MRPFDPVTRSFMRGQFTGERSGAPCEPRVSRKTSPEPVKDLRDLGAACVREERALARDREAALLEDAEGALVVLRRRREERPLGHEAQELRERAAREALPPELARDP